MSLYAHFASRKGWSSPDAAPKESQGEAHKEEVAPEEAVDAEKGSGPEGAAHP